MLRNTDGGGGGGGVSDFLEKSVTNSASSRIRFLPVQEFNRPPRGRHAARSRTVITMGDIFT